MILLLLLCCFVFVCILFVVGCFDFILFVVFVVFCCTVRGGYPTKRWDCPNLTDKSGEMWLGRAFSIPAIPPPSDSALLSRRFSFSTAGKSQVIKKTWMQESTIGRWHSLQRYRWQNRHFTLHQLQTTQTIATIAPKANIFLPCDAENVNASRGFCAVERGIDQ